MADLESIIAGKTAADAEWREQRQSERENASELRDAGIMEITSDPAAYLQYLELQGRNPVYSAGNVAIVQFSLENPTVFGTAERWKSLGRTVMESEKENGAKIFARGANPARGYILANAYDISQTSGKPVKTVALADGTPQMEMALTKLLNYSPVSVYTDVEQEDVARYDPHEYRLSVNPEASDSVAFSAIAREIALARIHNKGENTAYDRAECMLDAESVSYILCKRFGIERRPPDAQGVAQLYEGWEIDDRIEALDSIQGMAKQIGRSIEQEILPSTPQRTPPRINRAAR